MNIKILTQHKDLNQNHLFNNNNIKIEHLIN